ncbi:GATA transcription factor 20 [Hibiscus syriacus]|uniref:GATA transcription factor 20 n=1 Tax=Hibiscus syriacus TaxID=106335 RepID=A0A6A2WJ22_HIBSY|nr:GATA transcription factor 18-like [Hibiscus syriacus]KAE8655995.1 GATA transcription factor 20 [Hibiscus syriacus]
MMHRCCSSQGNIMGPCSCALFHSQNNSSMLFSMPNHKSYDETDVYNSFTSYSSSSVDCTLSLGTPSTRLCEDDDRRSGNSCMSNCWDLLQNKNAHGYSQQTTKASRGSNGDGGSSSGNDSLLARRCANCDTTSTPLWRNGPRGPKSLCNACGIRFKKEERRASAANANASIAEQQYHGYNNNNSWSSMQYFSSPVNEIKFIEDGDPYLSWRLNVTDMPTNLVHDFTR